MSEYGPATLTVDTHWRDRFALLPWCPVGKDTPAWCPQLRTEASGYTICPVHGRVA